MSLTTVDFPAPVSPTSATVSPAAMDRSTPATASAGWPGYRKCTPASSRAPVRPRAAGRAGPAAADRAGRGSRVGTRPLTESETMQTLRWIAVSPGIAIGPALVIDPHGERLPHRNIAPESVAAELERLDRGLEQAGDPPEPGRGLLVGVEDLGELLHRREQLREVEEKGDERAS